jgi:DNA polymerase-3 subunit beta
MKFLATSNELYDALRTAGRARPSSATMPILKNVLLTREGDQLRARCTNLEQHVAASCDVIDWEQAGGPDTAALPYERLTDTLSALPDGETVELRVGSDLGVRLETDQGTYEMLAQAPDNFPDLPEIEDVGADQRINGELEEAIEKTKFATASDALRPAMEGMLLQPVGEDSRAVATDGHRLSKLDIETELAGPDLIVPEAALGMIARIGANLLQVGDGHVAVRGENASVYTRTIDETFPNYQSVIPDNDDTMEVGRETLLGTVQRAGLYTSSVSNQIRLTVYADRVEVDAEDVERSSEAQETIPCEYDGDPPLEIGFNAEYMEEILSVAESERVRFELSTPNRAAVVRPVGEEELTMLLMPVMLNDYA